MCNEADVLRGVQKDIIDWDMVSSLDAARIGSILGSGNYKYNEENDEFYVDDVFLQKYTYIAKADGMDVYKIGATNNLKRRAIELTKRKPYSFLGLSPIAYSTENIEHTLKTVLPCMRRKLPHPFDNAEEILIVGEEDIERIISLYGFQRIKDGGNVPGTILTTKRVSFFPKTGTCKITKFFSKVIS